MRDLESPDGAKGLETQATAVSPGTPLVSIPDRRRIDSDVRAFLREPSTPWIVFDREGRPPSQLAVGEMLSVPRRTLLSDYNFLPATAAVDASAAPPPVEPSSLALASDLERDDDSSDANDALALPTSPLRRRMLGAAAAAVAVLSILAAGAVALRSGTTAGPATAAAQPATRSFGGAVVPAEIPPPDLHVKAPVVAVVAPAAVPPAPAAPARDESPAKAAAKKLGRLSIAGEARSKDVFMDGKRMLGRGTRSFTVMCGMHAFAVGNRSNVRDVEVPCNAELLLTK